MDYKLSILALLCVLYLIPTVESGFVRGNRRHEEVLKQPPNPKDIYGENLPLLNGHIIAHTHDDVGWLKTVDEYYYGANQTIQDAGVQYILDTVIYALQQDPSRKFIYVEIAFFERWWNEQTESVKAIVKDLVARRQLEFINGGWCMNDEANTHYAAIVDQMTAGHDFLFREFGVRPRIGWHIDPFGHAATQASLFAQMGFDGFFFGRIEYDEHQIRNETKQLEFVWRGSTNFGKETEIWSHVLYADYCYLGGFAFEWANSPPIQDDPRLFDVNIKERADIFAAKLRQRAASNRHNNVFIPFGCDFQYQNAHVNFKNMDKLMKYINQHPEYRLNLKYSTPSIYLDDVHSADVTWEVRTGDFFPYADFPHAYWTGYFTSRPAIKGYVRDTNNLAHTTDKIFATSGLSLSDNKFVDRSSLFHKISIMTDAYGIAQHHDAVAGTEKQHVADDYAKRMYIGGEAAYSVVNSVLGVLTGNLTGTSLDFQFCPLLNVSQCETLEHGGAVSVVMYNPLAWHRSDYYAKLVVPNSAYQVFDHNGVEISADILPNQDKKGYYTVVFPTRLPALGYTTYFLVPSNSSKSQVVKPHSVAVGNGEMIENDFFSVSFTGGRMSSIRVKSMNQTFSLAQDFLWWNASAGNNEDTQASGAYIFRPNGTTPFTILPKGSNPLLSLVTGSQVQEVRQTWNKWVSQVVRLYRASNEVEFEITIGAIDIEDGLGKEVISRWSSQLKTQGKLYTDSEGMEMMTRVRNFRPWPFNNTEPIASNYYPMNTAAYLEDQSLRLTFLTDRSRGCSSLADGQFENMIQRRLLYDDARGVDEPLNETETVRTTERLIAETGSRSARLQRHGALFLNNPPTLAFTSMRGANLRDWIKKHRTEWSAVSHMLPPNVHLLNMKPLEDGSVLIRLHHIFSIGEDSDYSKPAKVDLTTLFKGLRLLRASEMSLSANQLRSEMHRLNWKTTSEASPQLSFDLVKDVSSIVLRPMEIRTFVVQFQNF